MTSSRSGEQKALEWGLIDRVVHWIEEPAAA